MLFQEIHQTWILPTVWATITSIRWATFLLSTVDRFCDTRARRCWKRIPQFRALYGWNLYKVHLKLVACIFPKEHWLASCRIGPQIIIKLLDERSPPAPQTLLLRVTGIQRAMLLFLAKLSSEWCDGDLRGFASLQTYTRTRRHTQHCAKSEIQGIKCKINSSAGLWSGFITVSMMRCNGTL